MQQIDSHLIDNYQAVRQTCAWWPESEQRAIVVEGPDAGSYLQTQLTQDVLKLDIGQGALAALVDRKAHVRAILSLHRQQAERFLLLPVMGAEALLAHLEQFHFMEKLSLSEERWQRLRLEGPQSLDLLQQIAPLPLEKLQRWQIKSLVFPGGSGWLIPDSFSGESGFLLLARPEQQAPLQQLLTQQLKIPQAEPEVLEWLRLEAGQPLPGQDMTAETQLPETGLEKQAVSYDKGCYLGQEVIARIHAYGVVPRALVGLVLDSSQPDLKLPAAFQIEGKKAGEITSLGWSPQLQRPVALAYLHKKWRENGRQVQLDSDGHSLSAEVRRLPLYTPLPPEARARQLYEQALDIFAHQGEAEAIPMLQSAIRLDPQLADAYESLGVLHSRLGQHEAAIEVMQQLTRIAPEEPMAHTNLSRFYMLLGDKPTAENHMAEATRLNMLRQQRQQQQQQAEAAAQKAALIAMFREVLTEEDPDDLVANFGLGKALVDSENYSEAVIYLEKAATVDPFYSAAYLQWGKALEALGQTAQARAVYSRGMEAAAEKGDLMPLKEMEQRLALLPA
ncbi:MAG: tetratricopeptide repeat protein [Candidatus Sericytochromatia bacterium]|nr:tetratricopeptide repeat protein [Candidatus Sericytochromatia bacterium]